MAQGYIDNDTQKRFQAFFEGDNEKDLEDQMDNLKSKLEGSATLEAQATGETLKEAREELQAQIKESLYGG